MSHPHHLHREHQVSHRRVHHILKDEPAGAKHHASGHAFSKVTSKTAAEHHDKVSGHKGAKRYARGGKVKHGKGHQTNIAIVTPHPGVAGGAPPMPGGPPGGPMPPPMAGPGGPPPMGGPPGMPPGMPMRARGGRTGANIDGESTKPNLKKWSKRASANKSYARGGAAKLTAGAATGVGRLEQEELMERRRGEKT